MSIFTIPDGQNDLTHPLDSDSALDLFARQYFQLIPVGQLYWPNATIVRSLIHQQWLYRNLFSTEGMYSAETVESQYPDLRPPAGYQLKVLQGLVDRVLQSIQDPENDEVFDGLMNTLSVLFSQGPGSQPQYSMDTQESYVTYYFPLNESWKPVTVLEQRNVISSIGTTGLRTWEAALHLGSFLASGTEVGESLSPAEKYITNKHVLELGAGTGVLSILCSKHFKSKIMTSTDGSLAVVRHIANNCQLNEIDVEPSQSVNWKGAKSFQATELWWGDVLADTPLDPLMYGPAPVETIIAADILYDDSAIPHLIKTFLQFFNAQPTIHILLATTVRNKQLLNQFRQACETHKFYVQDIEFSDSKSESQQTGPFYATLVDLVILHITSVHHAPTESKDMNNTGQAPLPGGVNEEEMESPWMGG